MSVRWGERWCFAFSFFNLASMPVFLGATAEALTNAAVEILQLVPHFFLLSLALVLVLALDAVALALALSPWSDSDSYAMVCMSSCGRINNYGVFCALLAEVKRKYAALSNDPATDSCHCAALLGLWTKSTIR